MDNTLKFCLNVWIFMDWATGSTVQASATACAFTGTEGDKKVVLRSLYATDLRTGSGVRAPKQYVLTTRGGLLESTPLISGVDQSDLVLEAVEALGDMPLQAVVRGETPGPARMRVHDSPLRDTSVVEERADGTLATRGCRVGGER
ncbi:hypothetical protein [Micrococcus sp.]|uniref:hypothetical protein n=1 Tax=Micrococcus sp. TaxID=1271 RepID=UPI002A913118|nr:hypothetical protein [Micrococcus sp.]MDY6054536.1 hypothetical protein [Micrococcus sp.]